MNTKTIATHDDCGIITEIRIIHGQVVVIENGEEDVPRRRHAETLEELFCFTKDMRLTDEQLDKAVGAIVGIDAAISAPTLTT